MGLAAEEWRCHRPLSSSHHSSTQESSTQNPLDRQLIPEGRTEEQSAIRIARVDV